MLDEETSLAPGTVVHNRPVEPLALEVVLDGAASLDRGVDADADDADTKEEEHGRPLEHSHASALSSHLRRDLAIAMWTGQLLRLFACFLLLDLTECLRLVFDL